MQPTILYEDKDILAINKPAGLVVHNDGKTKEPTLTDWILEKYPDLKEVGEPERDSNGNVIYRPGIVHRLDRETSGVMLVAKNQKAYEYLKNQFKKREIKKIYHAFVWGNFKEKEGIIDRSIGRSSSDFRKWSAQRGARGEMREAVTNYKVISENNDYSFVEVRPETGRTHQIRVHFKAINHPLVSDKLYGPKVPNTLGFNRLALHSSEVTFRDLNNQNHTVSAPYPADFEEAIILLQK